MFYEILQEIMDERNLKIPDVARLTGLSDSTIRSIITRRSKTVALEVAFKISLGLGVSIERLNGTDGHKVIENAHPLISKYNFLDEYGKQVVNSVLQLEYDRCKKQAEIKRVNEECGADNIIEMATRQIPLPTLPTAAGMGEFLDSNDYELIDIPDDISTKNATFAVRVSGDSMEPNYYDGDIVLVKQQPYVETGEIGVFILNGNGYIKKCGNNELVSLNPKYSPIKIRECDELRTSGKVIGKL